MTVCAAQGQTVYDAATNFNVSNNPSASSVFAYGEGATPAAFSAVSNVTLNPIGTPSAQIDSNTTPDAIFGWNGTGSTQNWGGTGINQPPTFVRMDPQNTAGDILQFTAPTTGTYSITGTFQGLDGNRSRFGGQVSVSIFENNTILFAPATISDTSTPVNFDFPSLALTAGDTIAFTFLESQASSLGPGDFDSTGLQAAITAPSVPEPATFVSIAVAAPLVLGARRRRHS